MRILAIAALAGTILAGAVSTSQAFTTPIALTSGSGSASYTDTPVGPGPSSFDDAFTFTSASNFKLNFSLTSSLAGGISLPIITSTNFRFLSGTPGSGSQIALIPTTGVAEAQFGSYSGSSIFSAGSYYFELAGTTDGGSGAASSLTNAVTVSVSSVPIPATLPMFGAALLGLGAAGFVMRRRNAGPSFATTSAW